MKKCTKCGSTKPLIEYNKHKNSPDGHKARCRLCQNEDYAEYKERNIEKERIRNRDYARRVREVNPEKLNEATRRWRLENPEASKSSSRKSNLNWRINNPESYTESTRRATKKYRESNKERHIAHMRLGSAVLSGKIVKPDVCERCGEDKQLDGHHHSYTEEFWYDVEWLCRACHKDEHNKGE